MQLIVIGGGAAGFFAAIHAAENNPKAKVIILEKSKEVLSKVKISGGGRCNVTHACYDPRDLTKHYPRGERELLGPFHHFACGDTISWFAERGVALKTEEDGRIFPVSDNSQTIIDCLVTAAKRAGVQVFLQQAVKTLIPPSEHNPRWAVETTKQKIAADRILVATGSSPAMWKVLADLGHRIVEPVPSLFTFNTKDARLKDLLGIAVPDAKVHLEGSKLWTAGPLLITHWGLSGPAVLKLSAWGARELAEKQYQFSIRINWTGLDVEKVKAELEQYKQQEGKKACAANPKFGLPTRLWKSLVQASGVGPEKRWGDLNKNDLGKLEMELAQGQFQINGKSTFKEEFVTAGGVDLREVNFKTFGSKLFPGLYFAGEVLDIDAITGGFNFQAAWSGGKIAGTEAVRG
jgi:predicted Rossmann fold flavoprotein